MTSASWPSRPSATGPEGVQTRADLARELTVLRVRSGLTLRDLANRTGTPLATIGGYFSGRHLPGPAQLVGFRAVLASCGVVHPDQVETWLEALARARLSSDGRVARVSSPYRGLEPFQVEDAHLFFGRQAVTSEIIGELSRLWEQPSEVVGPLVVVGPSGSGKSSLLRAGVVASLRSELQGVGARCWSAAVVTPSDDPVRALRACLASVTSTSPGDEARVVVVDQLEEVFALPAQTRDAFFRELVALRPPVALGVVGLRADFYEAAAREPFLVPALRCQHVLVVPMTESEVREAIVGPAQHSGAAIEEGLVDVLLADLTPRGPKGKAHDAGALPLLSHALAETWHRAQRNQLTIADYRAAGGLQGAVRKSAEDVYEALSPTSQDLARRIFCRLVRLDADAPPTRRRVGRHELEGLSADGARGAEEVLSRFVAARLVTADDGRVELSHEALLTAWPRLAHWLDVDRAGVRLHHQISDAANAWHEGGRDHSHLLRGTRLHVATEWAGEPGRQAALNRVEKEFLDASTALASAESRDAIRRARRMKQLFGAVISLALATSVLALLAFEARASANQARNQALSRQVAIEAQQLAPTDPSLSMQLALTAYRISPTVRARSALVGVSASEMPTRLLGPPGPTFLSAGMDGRLVAVAQSAADDVAVYSLSGRRLHLVAKVVAGASQAQLFAVALSPDGHLLAAGGTAGKVDLWNLADLSRPVRLPPLGGFSSTVYSMVFSPDGRSLAAASNDGTVRQWALGPSRAVLTSVVVAPGRQSMQAVAYSPDGRLLAAAGAGGTLMEWPSGTAHPVPATGHAGPSKLMSVAFSPNSRLVATGGEDDVVRLWPEKASGPLSQVHAPLGGFTSWVDSVAFSPDGQALAAGSSDNSMRLWGTHTWSLIADLEHPAPVTSVLFSPGGETLLTADAAGVVRLWSLPPPESYLEPGSVFTVDYTANGRMLAAVSGGPHGAVSLWDVTDPWRPFRVGVVTLPPPFGPVAGVEALSPNGKLLAVGDALARVRLVDLSNLRHPHLVGPVLTGASPAIEQLQFSPNGGVLAVGDDAGNVHLWDVKNPQHPLPLPPVSVKGIAPNILGLAFSPNGRLLAAGCADDKVWLWDIADPSHVTHLATLGGFANYAYSVVFTPDSRILAAGSADATVRLWDVADPAHPKLLGGPLTGPDSYVYSLSISPDGQTLAASTTDHAVWLWDIANPAHPQPLEDLTATAAQVFDVTFSPDGRSLVASGSDRLLQFWDYHPRQVATRICSFAGSALTRAEWAQYVPGASYNPPCGKQYET